MAEQRIESALSLNQYLVRPKRLPGEGLSAWLSRHFLMNGLALPWRLRSQLILSYRHRRDPEPRIEMLERINGLLPGEAQLVPESWVAWCFEQRPTNKEDWQSSSRQYYPHGFCPACMRERGYFLELWEIPVVTACPRHGLKLLSACSACGRGNGDWEWVDGRYQCQCGVPLEEFVPEAADRLSLAWARIVACHPGIALPPEFSFDGHPSAVDISLALQLKRVMGSLRIGVHGRLNEYRLLFDWPAYPRTILRRLVRRLFTNNVRPTKLLTGTENLAFVLCQLLAKLRLRNASLLEEVVQTELSHHCLLVFGNAVLFINPKMYPDGAAPLRQKFAAWWRGVNWNDGSEVSSVAPSYRSPCRYHRPLVIRIVLTLCRMADNGFPVSQLNCLRLWWFPPAAIRDANDPNGLLDSIAHELYGLQLAHLRGVADCLAELNGETLDGDD